MALPPVVAVGAVIAGNCDSVQHSVSLYYNTIMRNVFIAVLVSNALFLFFYRGYNSHDRIVSAVAGIFVLGIAFFPPTKEVVINCNYKILGYERPDWVRPAHLVSAGLYFLTLAYVSFFLFTKTDNNLVFTREKQKRNIIYRISGIVILISLLLIIAYMLKPDYILKKAEKYHPVFWLESIALWAFGTSWLIKGGVILKDKNIDRVF